MEKRICSNCEHEKPLTEFYKSIVYKGVQQYKRQCKDCYILIMKGEPRKKKQPMSRYERRKKWEAKNKEKVKEIRKQQNARRRDKRAAYYKNRYHNDPVYRYKRLLRSQVTHLLAGRIKSDTTFKLLGFTIEDFNARFRSQIDSFETQNIKTHIDHCIPLEWMTAEVPVNIAFDLRNLRITPEEENFDKKHYYPTAVPMEYLEEIKPYIKEEYLCW
jgi:hypothetical protein